MNRDQVFVGYWNMKNVVEMNFASGVMQNAITNMTDLHTYNIGSVHMFIANVLITNGQLLELAKVHVLVGVDSITKAACTL
jgi:hypothetical protein